MSVCTVSSAEGGVSPEDLSLIWGPAPCPRCGVEAVSVIVLKKALRDEDEDEALIGRRILCPRMCPRGQA